MRVMILPYPLEELRLENKTNSCGFRLCCIHVLLSGHSFLSLYVHSFIQHIFLSTFLMLGTDTEIKDVVLTLKEFKTFLKGNVRETDNNNKKSHTSIAFTMF